MWGLLAIVVVAMVGLVVLRFAGPSVGPAPGPAADAAPSSPPVRVRVELAGAKAMDNDRLFGEQRPPVDQDVAQEAARQVGVVLRDYVNAAFVADGTRLTTAPLDGLLSAPALAALSADDQVGLGATGATVRRVEAAPVVVRARVVTRGGAARSVVATYELRARVDAGDGAPVTLSQRATMVFVPDGDSGAWRADAVDAVLDLSLPSEGPS